MLTRNLTPETPEVGGQLPEGLKRFDLGETTDRPGFTGQVRISQIQYISRVFNYFWIALTLHFVSGSRPTNCLSPGQHVGLGRDDRLWIILIRLSAGGSVLNTCDI